VFWFEEPLHWYEPPSALIDLARHVSVPLATGESESNSRACRALADTGAIRFMQFDATRAGGVTEWLRVAAYCHLRGIRVSTHHDPHIHGHLAAAAPNGFDVETFPNPRRDPLWDRLFTERAQLVNGEVVLSDKPGFGFEVDWGFVRKYRAQ
jgi:L-alanine-DL-glutamate epimerase-like enolase superfamily enzyme